MSYKGREDGHEGSTGFELHHATDFSVKCNRVNFGEVLRRAMDEKFSDGWGWIRAHTRRGRPLPCVTGSTNASLEVFVVFGQGRFLRLLVLLLDLLLPLGIHLHLGRDEGGHGHELEVGIADEFARQPQEGLLKVVIGLGRDVVVLEVLLPMKHDGLGLDFSVLDVDLVTGQHDGYVLADADQIAMPIGHVLVSDARRHVEHDDGALALDVVAVAQAAELFLAGRVPHVEPDGAAISMEHQGVDLHAQRGHVLLFELARQMALDEGGLAGAAVAHQDQLERGHVLSFGHSVLSSGQGFDGGKSRRGKEYGMPPPKESNEQSINQSQSRVAQD